MSKEKPRKESNPLEEANFTGASTGMIGKTQQQKSAQNTEQNNESGSTK